MHTIYRITNQTNGKFYIGKISQTVEQRWKKHIEFSSRGKNIYFSNALRKYGPASFTLDTLSEVESEEWASCLERLWVLLLDSANPAVGYNSTLGGEGFSSGDLNPNRMNPKRGKDSPSYGRQVPVERRQKISQSLMGKLVGENNPFYGKQHTEETLNFLRDSQLGTKRGAPSEETREKIRQRMVGRVFSPETLEKMRRAKLGRPQTAEHIAKAAAARLGKKRGPYKRAA